MSGQCLIHLLLLPLGHRFKCLDAGALDGVESQALCREFHIVDQLATKANSLGDDAGKGLAEEARAVHGKRQPVEERLDDAGYLECIVRGCKDHPVRGHHLLDEQIPVVLQGAVLLAPLKAYLTASAVVEPVVVQADDFVFDFAHRLEIAQELHHCVVRVLLAGTSNECGNLLHLLTLPNSFLLGCGRVPTT